MWTKFWERLWEIVTIAGGDALGNSVIGTVIVIAVLVAYALVRWRWRRVRRENRKMAPGDLIFVGGLGVALFALLLVAGTVWQLLDQPSSPAAHGNDAETTKPVYFAADINARIQAIDRLDGIIAKHGEVRYQCQDFWNHFDQWMGNPPLLKDRLTQFSAEAKQLYDELNGALDEYHYRFPDIEAAVRNDKYSDMASLYSGSLGLASEVNKWKENPKILEIVRNTQQYNYFNTAIQGFYPWEQKTRQALATLRQRYERAEVRR